MLTLQFQVVASLPEVVDGCRFGPCAYTSISRHSLGPASCQLQAGVGTPGRYSDHVLAQARLTGLLRCMSNLVGAMQRRLNHVLAQACYRPVAVQRRLCIVFDSQMSLAMAPKLLMDASSGLVLTLQSPEAHVSHWGIKQIVAGRAWVPNLGMRVLGPCPCASQICWLVAVYEYPGRGRATACGPCPCAGR